MVKKKRHGLHKGQGNRRRISKERVKENLEKRGFKHPFITLPDGIEFFHAEFPKGKTSRTYYLNVIPFVVGKFNKEEEEGALWWRAKYDAAKNVGPDEVGVASPATIGKKCPIWEAFKQLSDDPDVDDDDIKDMRPKSREMYYVQDTEAEDGKIYLLDISYFLFGKKLDEELRSEEGEDFMTFSDPEEGCTLKLRFVQKSYGKSTYQEIDKIEFVERQGPEVTDEIIDSLPDPISLIKFMSYDEIKALMNGGNEEESPNPKPKKKKKKQSGPNLDEMDRSEMKSFIREENLDIKVTKSMDDDDLRETIKEALDW